MPCRRGRLACSRARDDRDLAGGGMAIHRAIRVGDVVRRDDTAGHAGHADDAVSLIGV